MLKELTSENLQKVSKKEKGLYVIMFSSTTCGPCKTMKPVMASLDSHNPDINVYSVDTGKDPGLAQHFQIRSVPTIHFCKKREILYSFHGVTPEAQMQYVINNKDDAHFLEHGEFKQDEEKKSYLFPALVVAIVTLFVLLFIFT
ncbi:MAG: thioredoxin family protein [Bacteriovoracaceae bacterium]|nr:thioredoxin family protein [Bacteriovoracaceae bacterium]